jgi:hypothetical protein
LHPNCRKCHPVYRQFDEKTTCLVNKNHGQP